jgi:hypothetical protein
MMRIGRVVEREDGKAQGLPGGDDRGVDARRTKKHIDKKRGDRR